MPKKIGNYFCQNIFLGEKENIGNILKYGIYQGNIPILFSTKVPNLTLGYGNTGTLV
jgi:hypothetical protein